jgi:hypothetical protein
VVRTKSSIVLSRLIDTPYGTPEQLGETPTPGDPAGVP